MRFLAFCEKKIAIPLYISFWVYVEYTNNQMHNSMCNPHMSFFAYVKILYEMYV
jgi:hypothetical protein